MKYLRAKAGSMRTIKIPRFLQELFGKRTTLFELTTILVSGLGISALLLAATLSEWQHLSLWQMTLLILLTFDIVGGVIANFSYATNLFYKNNPSKRIVFILIHVQPIVLALLFGRYYTIAFAVTAYTIIAALITNLLATHSAQRVIGATLTYAGIIGLLVMAHTSSVPLVLTAIFASYMFKVIYAFSVDHFAARK